MNNSLSVVHPELIVEWSKKNLPLTPDGITFGSNKVVWWKGSCGHEWQTSVKARSKGEKCPICSGARAVAGINDLSTLKPGLASEWSKKNEIKPTEVTVGSHKKVIWKCRLGHEWTASVKSRSINGSGCPYCSHNKVLVGFNDLATVVPKVADEWSEKNEKKPTEVTAFANRKAWWKCRDCDYEWNTLISTRSGGSKCPCCSGYTFIKGRNDLKTTHPEIAEEWSEKNYPLQPDEVNAKSRKNVWWHCKKCGNEWKSVINARIKGTVCPVCAEREVLAGYNDLATTDKNLLSDWDYEQNRIQPTEVSRTSAKRAWWKCRHGHSWSMKINERTILGKGCRICEQEYLSVFPAFALSYYSHMKGLKIELGSDRVLGIPLDTYIPSEQVAIEVNSGSEDMEILKEHLCQQRGIKRIKLPMKTNETELTDMNRNLMMSIDIVPVPTDEAVREAENRLLGVETNITNWQRKQNQNNNFSATVPYDMEQQKKEMKEFLDDLTTRDQRMMFAVLTMVHTADTKEQLDNDTEALLTTARKHLCQFAVLKYQQMDGLNTVMPYGTRKIDSFRTLTTESLAVFMPFRVQDIYDENGIYYGQNVISKNMIIADRSAAMEIVSSELIYC